MRWLKLGALAAVLLASGYEGAAQSPTYGIGRAPTAEEVRAWDIAISPTGKELPDGHGTAVEGARLYVQKGCAGCHGAQGSGSRAPILIKRQDTSGPMNSIPCLVPCIRDATVMALHSPYATVIWDYINRGMPLGVPAVQERRHQGDRRARPGEPAEGRDAEQGRRSSGARVEAQDATPRGLPVRLALHVPCP